MNKIELTQALRDSNNLSRSESEKIVTLFFDKMADALAKGDRVEIRGLCSFFVKKSRRYYQQIWIYIGNLVVYCCCNLSDLWRLCHYFRSMSD